MNIKQTTKTILLFLAINLIIANTQASALENTVSHIIIKNQAGIEYYNKKRIRIIKYGHPVVKIELIKHTKNGKRFIETEVLMDNILISENRVNQWREERLADETNH